MKFKNVAAAGAIALAAAVALSACSSNSGGSPSNSPSASALSGTITTGGSSAQANVQTAWTTAFTHTKNDSGVTINYDSSQGSGGGVTNWLNGSYDFAGTDAALTSDQYTQAKSMCGGDGGMDLPVYLSGVDIIFKLKGVSKLDLDGDTIAKIFSGKITTWNDPAITKDNPGTTLPATKIQVVRRADGSGTTDNFTTYLNQVDPTDWKYPASTAWPTIPGDKSSGQQGGSGVVNTVEAGNGTIGYADQSSVGKATAAAIEVGTSGTFVSYSAAAATESLSEAGTLASQGTGDNTVDLQDTKITSTSAYPIPLLSYDVVCQTFKSAKQAKLTKAYLSFVASATGQKIGAANAGAAPLPASLLSKDAASLKLIK